MYFSMPEALLVESSVELIFTAPSTIASSRKVVVWIDLDRSLRRSLPKSLSLSFLPHSPYTAHVAVIQAFQALSGNANAMNDLGWTSVGLFCSHVNVFH